jgi:hypothetical protein
VIRPVVWYTFVAVVVYLVVTNWRGANALLQSSTGGYAGIVRALQGR